MLPAGVARFVNQRLPFQEHLAKDSVLPSPDFLCHAVSPAPQHSSILRHDHPLLDQNACAEFCSRIAHRHQLQFRFGSLMYQNLLQVLPAYSLRPIGYTVPGDIHHRCLLLATITGHNGN
ncbi:MAG TPA: hypothetical protein VK208_06180, partial [Pyrinomonadaceae bacterium]|nr:hypothetical protein [Pyrinomonadaceae bacterium]